MGQKSPSLEFHWGLHRKILEKGIRLVCRPIARLCLSCSVPIQDITRIFKELYLECATEELRSSLGKEPSLRQISLATGLHRKELATLTGKITEEVEIRTYWLTRLIHEWQSNKLFQTKGGKPRALGYKKENNEFEKLAKGISSDMEPGSALKELERLGMIRKTGTKVTLDQSHLSVGADTEQIFLLLSTQIDTIIKSAVESATGYVEPKHHHLRTEFDNIFIEDIPKIRVWLEAEGRKFHKKVRTYLSNRDADLNYKPNKTAGGKFIFSSFAYHDDETDESDKANVA